MDNGALSTGGIKPSPEFQPENCLVSSFVGSKLHCINKSAGKQIPSSPSSRPHMLNGKCLKRHEVNLEDVINEASDTGVCRIDSWN